LGSSINKRAIVSLLLARLLYAVNYYNIATLFILMAKDLNSDISGLGLISSSFLLGIGINQVPAGLLAARYGSKKTIVAGTAIASTTCFLTSFSTSTVHVILLRFLAGIGMALVFGPGVKLMAENFGNYSSLAVGLYNSFFWIGGAVGLSIWIYIAEILGWRASIAISGGAGIISALFLFIALKDNEGEGRLGLDWSEAKEVILNKSVLTVGMAGMGVNACSTVVTQFTAFYLESSQSTPTFLASLIATSAIVSSAIAAIVSGRIFDRYTRLKMLFIISLIGLSTGLILESWGILPSVISATILVGAFSGFIQTVIFSEVRKVGERKARYEALAVSWVNGIQFFGSFWSPLAFSFAVSLSGYTVAWISNCLIILILSLPFVLLYQEKEKS
jgi:MFS family permease